MRNEIIMGVLLRSEGRISTLRPRTNLGLGLGKNKFHLRISEGKLERNYRD
jgi:hypothetical protein